MAYPKTTIVRPSALIGQTNGKLQSSILADIPGKDGAPIIRLLKDTAARAWRAMDAHARRDGIPLAATSLMDSYRPYEVQVRIFKERYTTKFLSGRPTRKWNGVTYYQLPGTAAAAVPGTSNHGNAMAVDNKNTSQAALNWLLKHAASYGWSWELDAEPWHLHYFAGDKIPQAVLDFERVPTPPTGPEKEWPYMDDVAFVRHMLVEYLGRRAQTQEEVDMHVYFKAANGDARWITMLADSPESVAYRKKVNEHFGFPNRA